MRVPGAPSALPSCRDTRRDEGVFGSGKQPLRSPRNHRPDQLSSFSERFGPRRPIGPALVPASSSKHGRHGVRSSAPSPQTHACNALVTEDNQGKGRSRHVDRTKAERYGVKTTQVVWVHRSKAASVIWGHIYIPDLNNTQRIPKQEGQVCTKDLILT